MYKTSQRCDEFEERGRGSTHGQTQTLFQLPVYRDAVQVNMLFTPWRIAMPWGGFTLKYQVVPEGLMMQPRGER